MLTLYDADRCPYCARVRIVLAEKGLEHETVVVDLEHRPARIYEKNPLRPPPRARRFGRPTLPSAPPVACSWNASTSSVVPTTRCDAATKKHGDGSTTSSRSSTRYSPAGRTSRGATSASRGRATLPRAVATARSTVSE